MVAIGAACTEMVAKAIRPTNVPTIVRNFSSASDDFGQA
jgi:hypothetical protein